MKNIHHTLVRFVQSVEVEAEASNDVTVRYSKPIVEIVEGGVTLEEASKALQLIEDEITYLRGLIEQRNNIYRSKDSRSSIDTKVSELAKSLLKRDNEFLKKLHLRDRYVWQSIEERIINLGGEYMIVPCLFKSL